MSKLELILLGRFQCLLSSGTQITLPMRKAEVLLAFLALSPGLRHPRERLINLLWSDRGEEQARNSLRQCLSAIRKALGDVAELALSVDRTTVRLNAGLVEVDAIEFERLALVGDYESLSTAADLYQGEFLEGISIRDPACQEWLDSERARFGRQFIEILTNLAETQLVSHDFGHAIRSAERLVKQDPLGETGWRLLMRAYADSGDRNHALQAFKRCQQVLRDELEVAPESATLELRDRIAGGAAKPVAAAAAAESEVSKPAPASKPSTDRSIAVLPFDNLSGDPEQEYFSDGITDSIILHLSLFPGLNVKSRNSSFAFKEQIKSLGEISRELGVHYIVEGSIRKSADRIRITVQLIEAGSGNQVWGKRYDAEIADLFDLEEDLSRTIAATVTGQIESNLQRIALAKGAADQQAYDLLLSGIYYFQRFTRQDMALAIDRLNQCLQKDPDNVRAHVLLNEAHVMDYLGRWTEDCRASFRQAEKHIRRAQELNADFGPTQVFLGEFLTFKGELEQAAKHIDRALEINPNDTDALTTKAVNLQARCRFDEALTTAELALALDPYHPWAEWEVAGSQYLCGRYEDALETVARFRTSPGFVLIFGIAANIKLGRIEAARQALRDFLQNCRESMLSMPQTIDEWYQYTRDNYPYVDPQINQALVDCLVEAGLGEETTSRSAADSGNVLPSILVLPFSNLSGDPEQEYFSDGITDSIIVSLSGFDGLQVKSRHTSNALRDSQKSIDEIGAELGVQYIVEGSVRKLGENVRITVQLDDTSSGNQVWGKRFESELENLFFMEEELVQTIAGTVSGRIGKELKSASLHKPAKDLKSYDYFLRGIYHLEKYNRKDCSIAQRQFQKCLEHDPDNAEAHAYLGAFYCTEIYENWSPDREQSKRLMLTHAEKAIELEPDNARAHAYLAEALMMHHEFERAEDHVNRAIELNPALADGYALKGFVMGSTRRYAEAIENAEISFRIDPHLPYMCWSAGEVFRACGQYERAVKTFRSMPHCPPSVHAQTAAALAGLEKMDEARSEMNRYLESARSHMPSLPNSESEWRTVWYDTMPYQYDEDADTLFELLLKAGLCDDLPEPTDDMPSIAVLPFENMSGDAEQEHFSDGITADLIDTLSKFRHLRTISRYSVQAYKTDRPPVAEIAARQGARYILEGSVRKSGERIRVNAELIDSAGERILWSERYDRDLDDLFAVQDEITQQIALAMKIRLDDGEMALNRSGTANTRAWELVLTAIDLQDTYIQKNIIEARQMARRAIDLDPDYAYAWVCLAWTYWQEAYSGWSDSIEDSMAQAAEANQRARQLNPESSEVWSQAATIHLMNHEAEAGFEDARRAIELEPGNAETQALMAYVCNFIGEHELARHHIEQTKKLCPVLPNWYYMIAGNVERLSGNLEEAARVLRQGIGVEPDSPLCRFYLIDVLMELGDEDGAAQLADEIRALDKNVTGKGFVRSESHDASIRDRFRANLEKFDLY